MTGLFMKNLIFAALGAIPYLSKGIQLLLEFQGGLEVAIEIGRNTGRKPRF